MSHSLSRWLAPAALLFVGAAFHAVDGLAQPGDPLDAKAKVPALVYESSLSAYRAEADSKPLGWREANDAVARVGGWRAYAREAQQPASAPQGASPGARAPQAPRPGDAVKTAPQGREKSP